MEIKTEKRRYRSNLSEIPVLKNRTEIVDALMVSLSKMSGFTKNDLYDGGGHELSWWRYRGVYVLVKEFLWTQKSAGTTFGLSSASVSGALDKLEAVLESAEKEHTLRPYIDKVIDEIVL